MDLLAELRRHTTDTTLLETMAQLLAERERQAAELAARDEKLRHAELKIQALTLELAHHKRLRFGVKSEALASAQRDLFQEAQAIDQAAIEAELEQVEQSLSATPQARRPRAGRQPLPVHLPRIEHRHEPASCTCADCGSTLKLIREDVTEQLDVEPAHFFVHRHIRPQYGCRHCQTVSAAAAPAALIDGGVASPGLLSWILTGKYLDHLPLYRLEQIAARNRVPLPRSNLAQWVGRSAVALQPLAERLCECLLEHPVLHADETPLQQLDPGSGKTRRAYLWAYRSNSLGEGPPIVLFDYQTSRSGSHARAFLGDWKGHLMVDDYGGYKALFGLGVTELGCLAHVRRKFFELHKAGSPIAEEALGRIAELYALESQAREWSVEARGQLRGEQARPRLLALREWLIETRLNVAEGSGTAKAIDYSLKRWVAYSRYADSGHLPLDNNGVENCIRPIAIGKKNWLFAGSERGGRHAAVIYSLLITARLNGLDPAAWLKDTLEKLPTWPNSRLDELLPLRQT